MATIKQQSLPTTAVPIARQNALRAWLIAQGHLPAVVNGKAYSTLDKLIQSVCELHGVTEDEYNRAR